MVKKFNFFVVVSILFIILAGCNSTSSNSDASDYPTKAIDAIVPWSAGSGSDIAFRGYIQYVSEELGEDINVRNVTGGNGAVGWAESATKPADGYNMSLMTFDILTNEALGTSTTSYKDFELINMFTIQGMLLITHSDYGYQGIEDFLAEGEKKKSSGKQLTIGVNGEFGLWHQAGVLMAEATGLEDAFNFVPFNGSADQNTELLGKHLDAIITSPTASISHIEEGTLVALASLTDERIEAFPDVPTFKELGYDVKYESFRAIAVPKGTPDSILEKLKEAGKKAFDNPEFQEWGTEANIDQRYLNSEESLTYIEELYPTVENAVSKFEIEQ